jgi:hypothetical protein
LAGAPVMLGGVAEYACVPEPGALS